GRSRGPRSAGAHTTSPGANAANGDSASCCTGPVPPRWCTQRRPGKPGRAGRAPGQYNAGRVTVSGRLAREHQGAVLAELRIAGITLGGEIAQAVGAVDAVFDDECAHHPARLFRVHADDANLPTLALLKLDSE